jgi:hypothetical protein
MPGGHICSKTRKSGIVCSGAQIDFLNPSWRGRGFTASMGDKAIFSGVMERISCRYGRMLIFYFVGLLSFCALCYCAAGPCWLIPSLFIALLVGTSFPPMQALCIASLVWLTGEIMHLLSPFSLLPAYYNEMNYLRIFNVTRGWSLQEAMLGLLLLIPLTYLASRFFRHPDFRRRLGIILLLCLLLNFPVKVLSFSPQFPALLNTDPVLKVDKFDGKTFLKTVFFMRAGESYYRAFTKALEENGGWFEGRLSVACVSIRMPLLFYFWKSLPSPSWILYVSWLMVMLCMALSYYTCRKRGDPLVALTAPLLLGALFLYTNVNWWLLFPDLWSSYFLVIALLLYVDGKPSASIVTAFFASCIREFAVLFLISGVVNALIRRKGLSEIGTWAAALAMSFFLNYLNNWAVQPYLGNKIGDLVSARFVLSWDFFLAMLTFGSVMILWRDLLMPAFFFAALLYPLFRLPRDYGYLASLTLAVMIMVLSTGGKLPSQFYSFNILPLVLTIFSLSVGEIAFRAAEDSDSVPPK